MGRSKKVRGNRKPMKFKAAVRDPKTLSSVCHSQRMISKKTIIKFHPSRVRFISSTNTVTDGTQVWSSCRTDNLFGDYVIESKNDNAIYVEIIDLAQLMQALKCAEHGVNVTMKLAKVDTRQMIKLSMQTLQEQHDVSHDVPVRVLTEIEANNIVAPALEDRVLQVVLPPLHELLTFVDRVRNAGCGSLTFRAVITSPDPVNAQTCRLLISADTLHSNFEMTYPNTEMIHRQAEDRDDEVPPPLTEASVTVDIKKFGRFLSVRGVCPSKVIAHLVDDKALVLSAYAVGETNLVFFIPSLIQR
jgi:hypothetical protein